MASSLSQLSILALPGETVQQAAQRRLAELQRAGYTPNLLGGSWTTSNAQGLSFLADTLALSQGATLAQIPFAPDLYGDLTVSRILERAAQLGARAVPTGIEVERALLTGQQPPPGSAPNPGLGYTGQPTATQGARTSGDTTPLLLGAAVAGALLWWLS